MALTHNTGRTPRARGDATNWFRVHRCEREPRIRLICFPHAGGTAQLFHDWPALLPEDVELLAARYPGRQERLAEPFAADMNALVDAITTALEPYLDRPVALFGHSMGSAVAHEVTLRLEARGLVPERLLVSARAAPYLAEHTRLHEADDETLIAAIRRLGDLGSDAFDIAELRELLLPALRADYRLIETHRPSHTRPVRAPIVAYAGQSDPGCTVEAVSAWSQLTMPGQFALRSFPGDHFYLVPCRRELVSDIAGRVHRDRDRLAVLVLPTGTGLRYRRQTPVEMLPRPRYPGAAPRSPGTSPATSLPVRRGTCRDAGPGLAGGPWRAPGGVLSPRDDRCGELRCLNWRYDVRLSRSARCLGGSCWR